MDTTAWRAYRQKSGSLRNLNLCSRNTGAPKHQLAFFASSVWVLAFPLRPVTLWPGRKRNRRWNLTQKKPGATGECYKRRFAKHLMRENISLIVCVSFIDWCIETAGLSCGTASDSGRLNLPPLPRPAPAAPHPEWQHWCGNLLKCSASCTASDLPGEHVKWSNTVQWPDCSGRKLFLALFFLFGKTPHVLWE